MTRDEFNDIVKQLGRRLYGYAFRFLRNQEEAEDAVQEIFIKLWNMGEKVDGYNSVSALATTMIKNYCVDQLRKQKNLYYEENINHDFKNYTSPSPHDQMEIMESSDIINKIVDNLPPGYGEMIRLRDIEGFSYEEIAVKTGQSINNLRVILSRARKLVRDEFNKYQYEYKKVGSVTRKVL